MTHYSIPINRQSRSVRWSGAVIVCHVAFLMFAGAGRADEAPPADDPAVMATLQALGDHSSALLDPVTVVLPPGFEQTPDYKVFVDHYMDKRGPGQRDYCNKMVYAPERRTALYAGGNHQVPHRMNDVWEYHLGANTWRLLYEPDGGNAGDHKAAYFLTSRNLVRNPDEPLTDKQRGEIEAYRKWWSENVTLSDGQLATRRGGPIMPIHTWDGFCYDPIAKRMVWAMGADPAAQPATQAYFTHQTIDHVQAQLDPRYTPLWSFDPVQRRWLHQRMAAADEPRPDLRGMGGSLTYLPDQQRCVWYVAAQNVSPHDHAMWLLDMTTNRWTQMHPNGGRSIEDLAFADHLAPRSEQQMAYDPKRRRLVAVIEHDTFMYDFAADAWSKVSTDERIFGHDAHSIFAYDPVGDVFLLAFAPDGQGKELKLAALDAATLQWELIEPNGPAIPAGQYGGHMGYFDPRLDAFVVHSRSSDRVWVYRHKRSAP
ncbi:MAG: hypothetical protein GC162_08335 [Planctomycetes bacterium]|nr:hypothetical protein [Planctomycetota bacterium]